MRGDFRYFSLKETTLSCTGDTRDEIRNPFRSCMNDLAPSAISLEDGEKEACKYVKERERERKRDEACWE